VLADIELSIIITTDRELRLDFSVKKCEEEILKLSSSSANSENTELLCYAKMI